MHASHLLQQRSNFIYREMKLKLSMSKLSNVLLLIGSVIIATSISQKDCLLHEKKSFMRDQSVSDIFDTGSYHTIKSASSLDASTLRLGGVAALNTVKSTGVLSGYFSTIVFDDVNCGSGSGKVFGHGFLLGACVVDYEFSSSTRREATDTTITIYSFNDTFCKSANQAAPSYITDYKEGICILGEKQFLRATIDVPLPGQSIIERCS